MAKKTTWAHSSLLVAVLLVPPQPAKVATTFANAVSIAASVAGDAIALAANLMPNIGGRNVSVTPVDAAAGAPTLSGTVRVSGRDQFGQTISEDIAFTTSVVYGEKIFQYISSAVLVDIAGNGAGDTLSLGFGDDVGVVGMWSPDLHEVRALQRCVAANTRTMITVSSTALDYTYFKLKAQGSGGSGAIVAGDHFELLLESDTNSPDDRFRTV